MTFKKGHFCVFASSPHEQQGAVGDIPKSWAAKLRGVPCRSVLPAVQLDRQIVKDICRSRNYPVLFGYVCVMAWGAQSRYIRQRAWKSRKIIEFRLEQLRLGNLTREEAYNLFCGENAVRWLGPSYFTKLLYFFSPTPDFYIMDQWTGKSVNLLTGKPIVQIACSKNGSPTSNNTGENYREFCKVVDLLAWRLGSSGEQIEERLFSRGGHHPAQWRAYVKNNINQKKVNH